MVTPFILHHIKLLASEASQKKKHMVKICSFRAKWGTADTVVPLLNYMLPPTVASDSVLTVMSLPKG